MDFFHYHYFAGTKKFIEVWKNFIEFFWKHFAVSNLFLTLFSPWKRDVSHSLQRGFHPAAWMTNGLENLMVRIVGALVRLSVIGMALFFEVLTFFIGAFLFLLWLALPAVLIGGIMGSGLALVNGKLEFFLAFLCLFLFGLFLSFLSFRSFSFSQRNYSLSNLGELAKQKWFERVWNRLGVNRIDFGQTILNDNQALDECLRKIDLSREEFEAIVNWEMSNQIERENRKKFWLRENLLADSPIGKNWVFAYTLGLDKYGTDLSVADYTEYRDARLIGMDRDLEELKLLLTRPSQNNVILVGEEGVGRDTLVHTLAREIRTMRAGAGFDNKRILLFNLREVVSGFGDGPELENKLSELFSEASYAGNVILFIRDIHQYLKSNAQSGGEDISEILSQFLAQPTFQIIGTTTSAELHENLEKMEGVMRYCDKILIEEMGVDETLKVLLYKLKETEKDRVLFTYKGLKMLVKYAERYLADAPFPEKALDLMEEVILYWSNNAHADLIDDEIVAKAVSNKIKVPLGEMSQGESDKLLNLESVLHQRVIGQEFAIKEIAGTMRRARVGMSSDSKPLGSFLFLGPTGVGKTESAKALAEAYFGSENRIIRLDMSEYQMRDSIDRIIGSASFEHEGYLVSKVKENPYALLLLDEIEKADHDILNLFLQILDEGNLTDVFGKKISFRNLIIIATSNAGADVIRNCVKEGLAPEIIREKVIDHAIREGIFRPELLNRFDGVVFFHPLDEQMATQITALMLTRYAEKLRREENISIEFAPEIIALVSQRSFDQTFGARNISRFIQDEIEDRVVRKIISGDIKKGDTFSFGKADLDEEQA